MKFLINFGKPIDAREDYPRKIIIRKLLLRGCKFEISTPIESYRVEMFGGEEEFVRLILKELKRGDTFFDIGACVGLITIHAAKKCRRVFAFEPDTSFRKRLKQNIDLNKLSNVKVIDWAVSNETGQKALYTDGLAGFSPSLVPNDGRSSIIVATKTVDSAIENGELAVPNLIKVDIEGAEILALKGMQNLLLSDKAPRKIFIEAHPGQLKSFNSDIDTLRELFSSLNYRLIYEKNRESEIHCVFEK